MKKVIIQIVLGIIIIVLGYLVYDSIQQPLEFLKEKRHREVEVVQRLKDIREIQAYYKNAKGNYTPIFDSLIDFLSYGEIPKIKLIPDPEDTTFTKTIADTLGFVKVRDSLFSHRRNFRESELRFIPFTDQILFEMDAGSIDRGGVKVSVFEVKAPFEAYLDGLDQQRILNLIAGEKDIEKYPGMKVGSMMEPSTDGNWE